MSSKFLAELSNDYEKLFETEIGYDVIIYAGKEQNVKEIHAHSNILCARSQYFRTEFSNEWAKKEDGKFILRKQNISPHLFDIILRFLYCGNIELKNLQGPDVLNLLIAVDELNIHSLITYIQEYLIEHQTEFLHQNPTGILETVYQHETFMDLWNFCLEKIYSYKKNDIPYEFKLLYCSSRDGFDAASFHRNCDNKGATIWIAKIQGTTQLIGGYNPLDWDGNGVWKNTTDSFLFINIIDGKSISTAKLSYVNDNNASCAIYCESNQGPHMGNFYCNGTDNWTFYYSDISDANFAYPKIGIPESFKVEKYEVFQKGLFDINLC
ncbi:BTB-domain-containing protein [Rhizophagus irregularis]|nr:BTB-domain-containing protein [Rhizophagus irregularis]